MVVARQRLSSSFHVCSAIRVHVGDISRITNLIGWRGAAQRGWMPPFREAGGKAGRLDLVAPVQTRRRAAPEPPACPLCPMFGRRGGVRARELLEGPRSPTVAASTETTHARRERFAQDGRDRHLGQPRHRRHGFRPTSPTGVGFLDHMLELLARHALFDISVSCQGRPAYRPAPHRRGYRHCAGPGLLCRRSATRRASPATPVCDLPMDETLSRVAVDISGRPFLVFRTEFTARENRRFRHRAGARVVPGLRHERRDHAACRDALRRNSHHIAESCFKGLARALRTAVATRPARSGPGSFHQGRALNDARCSRRIPGPDQ